MFRAFLALVCVCLCMVGHSKERTWIDQTGKHKVKGELVSVVLVLKLEDGSTRNLSLSKLSHDDRRFVVDEILRLNREASEPSSEETNAAFDAMVRKQQQQAATKKTLELQKAIKVRKFIRAHLVALEKFKLTAEFNAKGFGAGGPYNAWLKQLEKQKELADKNGTSLKLRIALGDLEMLGLHYASHGPNGKDGHPEYARKTIIGAIENK